MSSSIEGERSRVVVSRGLMAANITAKWRWKCHVDCVLVVYVAILACNALSTSTFIGILSIAPFFITHSAAAYVISSISTPSRNWNRKWQTNLITPPQQSAQFVLRKRCRGLGHQSSNEIPSPAIARTSGIPDLILRYRDSLFVNHSPGRCAEECTWWTKRAYYIRGGEFRLASESVKEDGGGSCGSWYSKSFWKCINFCGRSGVKDSNEFPRLALIDDKPINILPFKFGRYLSGRKHRWGVVDGRYVRALGFSVEELVEGWLQGNLVLEKYVSCGRRMERR